ncbi:hypothetical protein [Parasphingorhabdus sp.]|uniref:hypothetical protein n=1 Tax=Parasphingorhabdus sp. TaxID=2709688 RepID=UPI003BB18D3A
MKTKLSTSLLLIAGISGCSEPNICDAQVVDVYFLNFSGEQVSMHLGDRKLVDEKLQIPEDETVGISKFLTLQNDCSSKLQLSIQGEGARFDGLIPNRTKTIYIDPIGSKVIEFSVYEAALD